MGIEDFDYELHEAIEDLMESGEIEKGTPAYGVSQQVISMGYESLSPKQRTVYDKAVVPLLERRGKELEMIQIANSAAD